MEIETSANYLSTGSILQMHDVWASYDGRSYALRGINLSVEIGKNYTVIGPSGSGKTTLLKLVNGMVMPNKVKSRFLAEARICVIISLR